jgi:hypoxanthine phosphoribosyltransferase
MRVVDNIDQIIYDDQIAGLPMKDVVLVCILKGAVYFTVDLSRSLEPHLNHKLYFLEVSSYKDEMKRGDHTTILKEFDTEYFTDKIVIILDELCDSGHTLKTVKDSLLSVMDEKYIRTCVMMKKNIESVIIPDLVGMEIPNEWVKGYGLDNKGFERGLCEIWYRTPEE